MRWMGLREMVGGRMEVCEGEVGGMSDNEMSKRSKKV